MQLAAKERWAPPSPVPLIKSGCLAGGNALVKLSELAQYQDKWVEFSNL